MTLTLITPPAIEPLDLVAAKNYLRVESEADDDLISDLIVAARLECEHRTGRCFITQTWRLTLDGFAPTLQLPRPPLIAVESISFLGQDGRETLFDLDDLIVSPGTPGRLAPRDGCHWPQRGGLSIEYTAGYGPNSSDIPRNIVQAIRLLVAHYYEHRSEDAPVPQAVDSLLIPSWVPSYA